MGSIYQRGEIFWIKYRDHGQVIRESSKSDKRADAERLLKSREGEIADGKPAGIYFDRVTFDELAKGFLADYRINQRKSLERAERSIRRVLAEFKGVRVPEITTPRIQEFIEQRLGEGAAPASVNRELAALKRALNLGARQTPPLVQRVPWVPMLRENNVRKGFFEHGEFLAVRSALPDYLGGVVTFAYKSGWRLEEILTLKWSQVDLGQGVVRLEPGTTKNDQGRELYLDAELSELLGALHAARKTAERISPFVFTNEAGKDRIKDFYKAWVSACIECGFYTIDDQGRKKPPKRFHDFRRTAIRNMVRAAIPERVAMTISGHKTRAVFDRYNIVSSEDLKAAAARHEAYLQGQPGTKLGTIVDLAEKKAAESKD